MSDSSPLDRADLLRGTLRQFVENYLRHRQPQEMVGEFLHEDGWKNKQFGLAGTCLVAHMDGEERLVGRSGDVWRIIEHGLCTSPEKSEAREFPYLKTYRAYRTRRS